MWKWDGAPRIGCRATALRGSHPHRWGYVGGPPTVTCAAARTVPSYSWSLHLGRRQNIFLVPHRLLDKLSHASKQSRPLHLINSRSISYKILYFFFIPVEKERVWRGRGVWWSPAEDHVFELLFKTTDFSLLFI